MAILNIQIGGQHSVIQLDQCISQQSQHNFKYLPTSGITRQGMMPWLLGNVSSLSANAWGESQGLVGVGEFYLALRFFSHI